MSDVEQSEVPVAPKKTSRRISAAWIVPIVAILLGAYLIMRHFSGLGPTVQISFETAEGLEAGKTRVLCRSVEVGVVEQVSLSDSLDSVEISIRLQTESEKLLREDTRFWVVRPRVGSGGVSGLGTLLSGAYIELDPGTGEQGGERFVGLEEPPATSQNVPGRRVTLWATEAGSLDVGAPVTYLGLQVGQIERRQFDEDLGQIVYEAFVRSPFDRFLTENTKFWNNSGVTLDAGADGIKVETGSLETILRGGISFGLPRNSLAGDAAPEGARFKIYGNQESINDVTPSSDLTYVLLFDSSVRGLLEDAPVEFRGILIGRVVDVSFTYSESVDDQRVPVLIALDRERVEQIAVKDDLGAKLALERAVTQGLTATLRTGSLLTGALYVSLEFPEVVEGEAPPTGELKMVGKFPSIPTKEGGFAGIEERVKDILDMVRALPIEETVRQATQTLASIESTSGEAKGAITDARRTLRSLDSVLASEEFAALPADVQALLRDSRTTIAGVGPDSPIYTDVARTLEDLQATMQSVKVLVDSIENRPNALIFGREGDGNDPVPGRR